MLNRLIIKLKVDITPPAPKGAYAAQALLLKNFLQPQKLHNIFWFLALVAIKMISYKNKSIAEYCLSFLEPIIYEKINFWLSIRRKIHKSPACTKYLTSVSVSLRKQMRWLVGPNSQETIIRYLGVFLYDI